MADLIYKEPRPLLRAFAIGDKVKVLDREHKRIGTQKIIAVNSRCVKTACGRRWTLKGWRLGQGGAWPFPSIRHCG